MVFSSFEFVFIFLPIVLLGYWLLPDKCRNVLLFFSSLVFYTLGNWENPEYTALFFITIIVNFLVGRLIKSSKHKKTLLAGGVIFDFLWLFIFKYAEFFTGMKLGLTLPIGISFYTFQLVSYLVDVYRSECEAEQNFGTFGAYISMFPQLIAGPIVNFDMVEKSLNSCRRFDIVLFTEGIKIFIFGLGLKVLIANQVAGLWTNIQSIGFDSISCPLAWLGAVAFSFQLYFDFWGYSEMAIGLGKMLGVPLPMNFHNPYISLTMTEFWRRWHITLGSWFRRYVYIPLGGNRVSKFRWMVNLLVVWALTGLWHGASWNYVIWGLFLFVVLLIEKLFIGVFLNAHPIIGHAYMIVLIPLSWSIFAIEDFDALSLFIQRLFSFVSEQSSSGEFAGDFVKYLFDYKIVLTCALVFSTGVHKYIYEKISGTWLEAFVFGAVFWAAMYCLKIGLDDPFLYFRF